MDLAEERSRIDTGARPAADDEHQRDDNNEQHVVSGVVGHGLVLMRVCVSARLSS